MSGFQNRGGKKDQANRKQKKTEILAFLLVKNVVFKTKSSVRDPDKSLIISCHKPKRIKDKYHEYLHVQNTTSTFTKH